VFFIDHTRRKQNRAEVGSVWMQRPTREDDCEIAGGFVGAASCKGSMRGGAAKRRRRDAGAVGRKGRWWFTRERMGKRERVSEGKKVIHQETKHISISS
jgi:hypothetical protein